jgi:hypothetical protein
MSTKYALGPYIGIARLGNSQDSFYLAPDGIGALPIECDQNGNPVVQGGTFERVRRFKDDAGGVRRQGAWFRIFQIEDGKAGGTEITLDNPEVESITWTVHLASKKAAWYNFAELEGNLLYGQSNSYKNKDVPLRNASVTAASERQKLIIDPGPRTVDGALQSAEFSSDTIPPHYRFGSFPKKPRVGDQVTTLGGMRTDAVGRLIVLGGFGRAGGDTSISSFAGADTWHDDISDGPVYCTIKFKNAESVDLTAWCVVGSPKFAPELVNIITLDDTMYDVAVRHFNYDPAICLDGKFNEEYVANFDLDIQPILERPASYRWVANLPSMNSVSPPPFDARDSSNATSDLRQAYLALFRRPGPQDAVGPDQGVLFSPGGFPLIPLNSGSNSVSNSKDLIDKFLALTQTQYFLLKQWASGKFATDRPAPTDVASALTRASVGNCVGGPFCPGIEVTWNTRNPNIYLSPFVIRQRHDNAYYYDHGLSPSEDETEDALGCEPGDMTKRMAIPWQADFFQCSIQFINFTNPKINKGDGVPAPPTYYAYWWPPQSPWQVLTGDLTVEGQTTAGTAAGFQVMYARGINTFAQMISSWFLMGFIVNQATDPYGRFFPYFTEQERDHAAFLAGSVAVGLASDVVAAQDQNFMNVWLLSTPTQAPQVRPTSLAAAKEAPAAASRAVSFPTSRQNGRQPLR